jgi:hypothetical protein
MTIRAKRFIGMCSTRSFVLSLQGPFICRDRLRNGANKVRQIGAPSPHPDGHGLGFGLDGDSSSASTFPLPALHRDLQQVWSNLQPFTSDLQPYPRFGLRPSPFEKALLKTLLVGIIEECRVVFNQEGDTLSTWRASPRPGLPDMDGQEA